MRCWGAVVLIVGFALCAHAQEERGWNFSGRLSGTANSSDAVLKVDPSVGYTLTSTFMHTQGYQFTSSVIRQPR